MTRDTTIRRSLPEGIAIDFSRLRELGVQRLEELATEQWTDFNTHDPGITILEALCYAITEISYRVALPIEDLLAPRENDDAPQAFHSAAKILPSAPVTNLDWRKLIIDRVPAVKNAWLDPVARTVFVDRKTGDQSFSASGLTEPLRYDIRGLYSLTVEDDDSRTTHAEIAQQVARVFHENRGLCEDLHTVKVLRSERVKICLDVELAPEADSLRALALIVHAIREYLSPPLRRHSLEELLARGKTPDQIFSGPLLNNGFILDEELQETEVRTRLYGSDLISLITAVEGVAAVRKLEMSLPTKRPPAEGESWVLQLSPNRKPRLDLDSSKFCLFKDILPIRADTDSAEFKDALKSVAERAEAPAAGGQDLPVRFGRRRPLGRYRSIQHEFPEVYGLEGKGLPRDASERRRTQAQQLQGYLLFFDQLLADLLAQLDHLRDLFAIEPAVRDTHFTAKVGGLGEITRLLNVDDEADYEKKLFEIRDRLQADDGLVRRHRFLDHLLARFGERFDEYVLLLGELSKEGFIDRSTEKILDDKVRYLKDLPALSRRRGSGFDSTTDPWDTDNVAGVKQRVSRLLGFPDGKRRNLADAEDEGLFVIENVMLRPRKDEDEFLPSCIDDDSSESLDPYSFQVHILVPSFAGRFGSDLENERMAFRQFVEKTIRQELPAHVLARVCFVDKTSLKSVEKAYQAWLEHRASADPDTADQDRSLNELTEALKKIHSDYPARRLHGIGDETHPKPIVLDRTHLGDPEDDSN